tara:strand:- start:117 stop:716 length:600 start_codon:yes stop_codon:yes gene_type:complete
MLINEFPFFTREECDEIKQYAYKKEKELKGSTPLEVYNKSITTNNYDRYNFFEDHPVYAERLVSLLKETDAPLEWPIIVQSWVNIYRKGDGIGWHNHYGSGLSFNIFIDGDLAPGPSYVLAGEEGGLDKYDIQIKNLSNKKGYMQIFPSPVYHKVDPLNSELERITVAATIHSYTAINRKVLNLLSLNNKNNHGIIILS